MGLGAIDVSKPSIKYALQHNLSVMIVIGGAAEGNFYYLNFFFNNKINNK